MDFEGCIIGVGGGEAGQGFLGVKSAVGIHAVIEDIEKSKKGGAPKSKKDITPLRLVVR